MERIKPITENITFEVSKNELIQYKDNCLLMHNGTTKVKCVKILKHFKVYVDNMWKGNSRYADEHNEYYIVDTRTETILWPSSHDYGSIVATLKKLIEESTPLGEKIAPFVTDIRVMTMTLQNLILEGYQFEELEDGRLKMISDTNDEQVFKNDAEFKSWIIDKSLNY